MCILLCVRVFCTVTRHVVCLHKSRGRGANKRGGGGGGGGEVGGCAVWTTINNPGLIHPFAVTVFFGVSMSCKK